MQLLAQYLLIVITITLSTNSLARSEIPFCPAGGPPGWMNYFDYKRDRNIRQYYTSHPPANFYYNYYPGHLRGAPYPVNTYVSYPNVKQPLTR